MKKAKINYYLVFLLSNSALFLNEKGKYATFFADN